MPAPKPEPAAAKPAQALQAVSQPARDASAKPVSSTAQVWPCELLPCELPHWAARLARGRICRLPVKGMDSWAVCLDSTLAYPATQA